MINIDKGIPVPIKYPFHKMEVDDSFIVPDNIKRSAVGIAARRYGVANNKKFTFRRLKDGTYRCWRIA